MPLPFIGWFMASKLGRMLAMAGGLLLAVFVIFKRGKAAARKEQRIDDLEFGADIRRKTDESEKRHEADMDSLPADDAARRRELADRLRKARGGGGGD